MDFEPASEFNTERGAQNSENHVLALARRYARQRYESEVGIARTQLPTGGVVNRYMSKKATWTKKYDPVTGNLVEETQT